MTILSAMLNQSYMTIFAQRRMEGRGSIAAKFFYTVKIKQVFINLIQIVILILISKATKTNFLIIIKETRELKWYTRKYVFNIKEVSNKGIN